MIEKHDVLQMVRSVFKRSRGKTEHKIMHPYREWSGGLFFTILCLVAGGWYAAHQYMYYRDIADSAVIAEDDQVEFEVSVMEQVIALFTDKANENARWLQVLADVEVIMPAEPDTQTATTTATSSPNILNEDLFEAEEQVATTAESGAEAAVADEAGVSEVQSVATTTTDL